MTREGSVFPAFELPDENGQLKSLATLIKNGPLVLFFYPKDNTVGCTKEACEFRDSYSLFNKLKATVIGISSDNQKSHKAFKQTHQLNYSLLTDIGGILRKKAGVESSFFGLIPGRVTFVIGKDGIIKQITKSQLDFSGHIKNSIKALEEIDRSNANSSQESHKRE